MSDAPPRLSPEDRCRLADRTLPHGDDSAGVVESSSTPFNLTSTASDGLLGTGRSIGSQQYALTVPEAILARGLGTGVTGYRLGRRRDGAK